MNIKTKMKRLSMIAILLILSLSIIGCGDGNSKDDMKSDTENADIKNTKDNKEEKLTQEVSDKDLQEKIDQLEKKNEDLNEKITTLNNSGIQGNLLSKSLQVMNYIKIKDFQGLSNHVHPSKGVRFSPYFFVDAQNHQSFTSQEIASISQNTNVLNWGVENGTGNPIELNFSDYYDRYIYDQEYLNPHLVGVNNIIGQGNISDNGSNVYIDGKFVEYHFTGFDIQYEGMDWRSLRLVFENSGGTWYLVGVVHGEWTT